MSDEQQQAAIGRMVEEYVDCKKRLVSRQAEAHEIAGRLTQVASNLRALSEMTSTAGPQVIDLIAQESTNFPSGESMLAVANQIKQETDKKHELYESLKRMGFEPKD
jgi:hypothetical protein